MEIPRSSRRRGAGERCGRKVAGSARHSPQRVPRPMVLAVRYPPLGSPWSTLKRSYVHVPVTRGPVYPSCWLGRPIPGVVRLGGYREGGTTQLLHHGIARAQPMHCQGPTVSPWHSRPEPGPSAHHGSRTRRIPASGPIKARFSGIYPKVSPYPGVSTVFSS